MRNHDEPCEAWSWESMPPCGVDVALALEKSIGYPFCEAPVEDIRRMGEREAYRITNQGPVRVLCPKCGQQWRKRISPWQRLKHWATVWWHK